MSKIEWKPGNMLYPLPVENGVVAERSRTEDEV